MAQAMEQKSTNIIGIAAIAAAAGALTALLLAPKSGEEMRQDIMDRTQRAKEMSRQKIEMAKSKARSLKGKTAEKMEDMSDQMAASSQTINDTTIL
jgi:gas vesicle protein